MNKVKTIDEGIASLGETLKDGRALLKFEDMIKHQGVEEKTARELCHGCIDLVLPRAEHVTAVEAQSSGNYSLIYIMFIHRNVSYNLSH